MKFKDFEIKKCVGINGEHHTFELVKWYKYEGRDVCYVVAWIDWDDTEPCWQFTSVGTRFINDYVDGLCEYIRKFLDLATFIQTIDDYKE